MRSLKVFPRDSSTPLRFARNDDNRLASRCRAYRAFRQSHGADEFFERTMIFHAGRAFNPATNVDRVRHHCRDRATNILRVQAAGENQKTRVAHRSARSGPIARSTRAATELGVIRIDQYVAM